MNRLRRLLDLYLFGRRTDRPLSTRRAVALATLADVEGRRPKPATRPLPLQPSAARHRAPSSLAHRIGVR